jgi:copper chaperone CopZ
MEDEKMSLFNKKKKVVIIEGMSCNHCKGSVEMKLKCIPNIENVKVNLSTKKAIITYKDELDNNSIINAINSLNFKVISIEDK